MTISQKPMVHRGCAFKLCFAGQSKCPVENNFHFLVQAVQHPVHACIKDAFWLPGSLQTIRENSVHVKDEKRDEFACLSGIFKFLSRDRIMNEYLMWYLDKKYKNSRTIKQNTLKMWNHPDQKFISPLPQERLEKISRYLNVTYLCPVCGSIDVYAWRVAFDKGHICLIWGGGFDCLLDAVLLGNEHLCKC